MAESMDAVLRAERLDDIEALLSPREWDEVPLVSRLDRIAFLSGLDAGEASRVLLVAAVAHLGRIIEVAEAKPRGDLVVMVSLANWEDFLVPEPEVLIPNYWICTNVARDLVRFRMQPASSRPAAIVAEWLASASLLRDHEVFDPSELPADDGVRRVYVARRGHFGIERFVDRAARR